MHAKECLKVYIVQCTGTDQAASQGRILPGDCRQRSMHHKLEAGQCTCILESTVASV
jgi:hypothetical protein